jgi:hypothetical protein
VASKGSKKAPAPVVGVYEPPRDAVVHVKPSDGFDRAFEDALKKAARRWGKPQKVEVDVRLEARVDVWNPGGVGVYRAVMTPKNDSH